MQLLRDIRGLAAGIVLVAVGVVKVTRAFVRDEVTRWRHP